MTVYREGMPDDTKKVTLPHARTKTSRKAGDTLVKTGRVYIFARNYFLWAREQEDHGCTRYEANLAMTARANGEDQQNSIRGRTADFLACGLMIRTTRCRPNSKGNDEEVLVVPPDADFANYRPISRDVSLHQCEEAVLPLIFAWRMALEGNAHLDRREEALHNLLRLYGLDPHGAPPTPPTEVDLNAYGWGEDDGL